MSFASPLYLILRATDSTVDEQSQPINDTFGNESKIKSYLDLFIASSYVLQGLIERHNSPAVRLTQFSRRNKLFRAFPGNAFPWKQRHLAGSTV